MKHLKKIIKVSAITIFTFLSLLFIIVYFMYSSLDRVTQVDLKEVTRITGLQFTNNVKLLGSEYISSLDNQLYVVLEMPEDDLNKLFPEKEFKPSATRRFLENESREREWFDPDSIKNFKSFSYTSPDGKNAMYVLYSKSGKTRKVYIMWFSF